jgi:hypothetical protein
MAPRLIELAVLTPAGSGTLDAVHEAPDRVSINPYPADESE